MPVRTFIVLIALYTVGLALVRAFGMLETGPFSLSVPQRIWQETAQVLAIVCGA